MLKTLRTNTFAKNIQYFYNSVKLHTLSGIARFNSRLSALADGKAS